MDDICREVNKSRLIDNLNLSGVRNVLNEDRMDITIEWLNHHTQLSRNRVLWKFRYDVYNLNTYFVLRIMDNGRHEVYITQNKNGRQFNEVLLGVVECKKELETLFKAVTRGESILNQKGQP